ncbi:MAG: HAD family hydrolase [Bacteroidota bacterium]
MIHLFVLDIDGCISHPFQSPDWEAITEIRELNLQSQKDPSIPSITLCTGRPFPYAEAVAQWLGIEHPFVFESSLLYFPKDHRVLTGHDGIPEPLQRFRGWLTDELLPEHPGAMLEFAKMMDAGVVSNDKELINRIYKRILQVTREHYPELEVHRTDASVNALPMGNNKVAGMERIATELRIPHEQIAYIGDSGGDLEALKRVAKPFAPLNAIAEVKKVAQTLPEEATRAVLLAYRQLIDENRNSAKNGEA